MQTKSPEPTHLKVFKWRGFFLFSLLFLVFATLWAIVYVQHEIRYVESSYYKTLQKTLIAKEEWGRLMLEKEHLTSPARVEQEANKLDMTLDKTHYQYIYIEPIQKPQPELREQGYADAEN